MVLRDFVRSAWGVAVVVFSLADDDDEWFEDEVSLVHSKLPGVMILIPNWDFVLAGIDCC